MNCPNEFEIKTTAGFWPLVFMGGFVMVMSPIVVVEVLRPFFRPKEWADVVTFGSQIISALCLVWFVMAVGINIPTVWRDWWEHRAEHLRIVYKYFAIYAGFVALVISVLVVILVFLEEAGKINPIIVDLADNADMGNQMVRLKHFLNNSIPRFILSVVGMCVLAPVTEEIFFRRFLFVALRKKTSFPLALFISSALFMVVHPNMALGAIGGIYLGYVYEKGKSLPANILVHAAANFSVIASSMAVMR